MIEVKSRSNGTFESTHTKNHRMEIKNINKKT